MKKHLRYYAPVLIILGIAALSFLIGTVLSVILTGVWHNITGVNMDDMGGYTMLFSAPLVGIGFLFSMFFRYAALILLIAAGVVFCVMTVRRIYKKAH